MTTEAPASPWRTRGTDVRGMTARDAMRTAGLDAWHVRTVPLNELRLISDDLGLRALVRFDQSDGDVRTILASNTLVTDNYVPIQNEDLMVNMVEALAGHSLPVDAAGVYGRLRNRAYITFDAGGVDMPGGEKYWNYLLGITSHTGRDAAKLLPMSMRLACTNMERAATRLAHSYGMLVTIQHNRDAIDGFWDNLDNVRRILGMQRQYNEHLRRMMTGMQRMSFDDNDFKTFVGRVRAQLLPLQDTEVKKSRLDERLRRLDAAWDLEKHRAAELGQKYPSEWTAVQTISTYAQHTSYGSPEQRAERAMSYSMGGSQATTALLDDMLSDQLVSKDGYRYLTGRERPKGHGGRHWRTATAIMATAPSTDNQQEELF